MERLKEFEKTPTVTLIDILSKASENNEQNLVNICAYELVSRIWVPNPEKSFTEMLKEFGYIELKELEHSKSKIKSKNK